MPKEPLPVFVYHPDPLDTGSIVESDDVCLVCGRMRGYLYKGPVYGRNTREIDDNICPWCIADGSAHELYGAEFTGDVGFLLDGERVERDIWDAVSCRTPGFTGWQDEQWWTHCGDAAMFWGLAGTRELKQRWPEAIPVIRAHIDSLGWDEDFKKEFMDHLYKDGQPTVYVFQCRHCGAFGAYWDMT